MNTVIMLNSISNQILKQQKEEAKVQGAAEKREIIKPANLNTVFT